MNANKPLVNCVVGISVSEATDLESLGFDRLDLNRAIVRLSELFLSAGARIAFGHDWRPGGVMEAVATLAVKYAEFPRVQNGSISVRNCPIINRVAFPDIPFLKRDCPSTEENEDSPSSMARLLRGIVDSKQSRKPENGERTKALSLMRQELSRLCDIRICFGGNAVNFEGRIPGVLEEALGSIENNKLLLVGSIFGGVSKMIVDCVDRDYINEGISSPKFSKEIERLRIWARNRVKILSREEERRLWYSVSTEEYSELVLRAAVKYWQSRHA